MKYLLLMYVPVLACVFLAMNSQAQIDTGKIRINGFASFVGGFTLNEGVERNPFTGAETDAEYVADVVTEGFYDEDLSFRPDTNLGIQVTANLGQGLSAIGQITGNGGEDFDAQVSWAYIRYDFNDNWQLKFGRQRLPYFFYSDFLDVGYAYHWIRPDPNLAAGSVDTLDGVNFSWRTTRGDYDWSLETFFGNSVEDIISLDVFAELDDIFGVVVKTSNDWLQLRASWSSSDSNIGGGVSRNGVEQGTDKNPIGITFFGLGAQMTFGSLAFVGEYTGSDFEEPFGPDGILDLDPVTPGAQPSPGGGLIGIDSVVAWYISAMVRIGDFTPHVTYAEEVSEFRQTELTQTIDEALASTTVGIRWDFHPSAAFKIEYITVSDESDDFRKNSAGPFLLGYGNGKEVDLFAFGVDVIF